MFSFRKESRLSTINENLAQQNICMIVHKMFAHLLWILKSFCIKNKFETLAANANYCGWQQNTVQAAIQL
jgi:hypothetical protein